MSAASNTPSVPQSERAYRTPDWEIRRQLGPGHFRTYAHGYWRNPFVVSVLGRVLIGKRGIRKSHERAGWL